MNSVETPTDGGRRASLSETRLDLLARQRLEEHPHFRHRSTTVIIETLGDTLVLTGRLPSYYLKQMLQQALVTLPGVVKIDDRVDVVSCSGLSSVPRSSTVALGNVEGSRNGGLVSGARRAACAGADRQS
jgi:hypothetical protein